MRSPARAPRRTLALVLLAASLVAGSRVAASGAVFTSTSRNATGTVAAAADWTPPTLTFVAPDAIRGNATLTATASDAETGIANVQLAWALDETSPWNTFCTRTQAPYSCVLATAPIPDGDIDLRAIATDSAGYSTTVLDATVVDNTAPTGAIQVGSPLAGNVTVTSTAADATSGVAQVVVQLAPAGATTWTTACTATTVPWSCQVSTTAFADGTYDFRALITDVAGNQATTATVKNRVIDNRASSVSVDPLPAIVRGTVSVAATANGAGGITSVRIEVQRVGTSTWTALCTDTTAPYACTWDTTTWADGDVLVRAVLLDGQAKTTTSATVATRVENTPVRGVDVQAANGGTLGRLDAGDQLVLTWNRTMRTTSILAGWTGASQAVTVRVRDGALLGLGSADDTLDVFTSTNLQTPVNVGSVNLRGNYVKGNKTVTFAATMTAQTVTVDGAPATQVTLVLGAPSATNRLRTTNASPTMVWAPSAAAVDQQQGLATATAPVVESGAADRDA